MKELKYFYGYLRKIFRVTDTLEFKVNKRREVVRVAVPHYVKEVFNDETALDQGIKEVFAKFNCSGAGNSILLGENTILKKLAIAVKGKNNKIIIGSNVNLSGLIVIAGDDITVFIGANTTFNDVKMYCKGGAHGVYIGRDCMFSSDIEIRTSDSHSVIDLDSMTKTNHPDGVYIGDHVWLAKHVFVQKGTVIGDDNIVGFGSMVNGDFSASNCMIVGKPAQAKTGRRVSWSRKGKLKVIDDTIFDWKKLPLL